MIGEGIQSSNQRRHSFVKDHVEVGFFTDPSVCIGCKACEVACKEWNQVPDDGFTWSGNSYDNTGHLGASTWRHVMFLEQDRQKGNQITGPMGLPAELATTARTDPQSDVSAVGLPEALSSARFVTIDRRADSFRPAPKFVRPNQSCLAVSMIFAHAERNACSN